MGYMHLPTAIPKGNRGASNGILPRSIRVQDSAEIWIRGMLYRAPQTILKWRPLPASVLWGAAGHWGIQGPQVCGADSCGI